MRILLPQHPPDTLPAAPVVLALSHLDRARSRLRTVLADGEEVLLRLPRGGVLQDGDWLADAQGLWVRIEAAPEAVSFVPVAEPQLRARAAWHLGNRHAAVEFLPAGLCYPKDPILDHMLQTLGLTVRHEQRPFHPEGGAYEAHAHASDR